MCNTTGNYKIPTEKHYFKVSDGKYIYLKDSIIVRSFVL